MAELSPADMLARLELLEERQTSLFKSWLAERGCFHASELAEATAFYAELRALETTLLDHYAGAALSGLLGRHEVESESSDLFSGSPSLPMGTAEEREHILTRAFQLATTALLVRRAVITASRDALPGKVIDVPTNEGGVKIAAATLRTAILPVREDV